MILNLDYLVGWEVYPLYVDFVGEVIVLDFSNLYPIAASIQDDAEY